MEVNHGHFVAVEVVRAMQLLADVDPVSEKEAQAIRNLVRRHARLPQDNERKAANANRLADIICKDVIRSYEEVNT